MLGKTNTPELGTIAQTESELNGACRDPWDTTRTPGGSSGGAAAATAAGLCPVAHGSDGGGSIRIPAACCGLVGLKPSRGRVSPGRTAGALGLGTSGSLARTVRDAAALLDVMAGYEPGDFFVAPQPERPFLAEARPRAGAGCGSRSRPSRRRRCRVDPVCVAAAESAAALLGELGHDVFEATPPWQSDEMILDFIRVWQVGPATAGIDDLSLLEPINRMLAEDARARRRAPSMRSRSWASSSSCGASSRSGRTSTCC